MSKVEKFVETNTTNLTPADVEVKNKVDSSTSSLPIHIQIEEDAQELLKKVQKAGIDFEVFLRGVFQRLEKAL
jgi:hypothetical protein